MTEPSPQTCTNLAASELALLKKEFMKATKDDQLRVQKGSLGSVLKEELGDRTKSRDVMKRAISSGVLIQTIKRNGSEAWLELTC